MKKFKVLILLLFSITVLFAQTRLLVDCIHGADYYGSEGMTPESIDFSAIFPDYEITYLNKDMLPMSNILVQETQNGNQVLNYLVDLPDTLVCLYVSVRYLQTESIPLINGYIADSQGNIISNFYGGVAHADSICGLNWQIQINLNLDIPAEIKIAYDQGLFKSLEYPHNLINLNDYDLVLRIKDNNYYAMIGSPSDYSNQDLNTINQAFNHGLRFFNLLNQENSMIDKPFVHFYTENDMAIDYEISLLGRPTYCNPTPLCSSQKLLWQKHALSSKKDNEIVYEGAFSHALNFLYFRINNDQLNIENLIYEDIYDLCLLRYHNHRYEYLSLEVIKANTNIEVSNWQVITVQDLVKLWKTKWLNSALKEGLYSEEAEHLINRYQWIEGLLYRAYRNEDHIYGLYRLDQKTYDKLVPYKCDPQPKQAIRLLWVMLSDIVNTGKRNPVNLPLILNSDKSFAEYTIHEYGVVDEYYQMQDRDNSFFGVSPSDWFYSLLDVPNTYDNTISQYVFNGINTLQGDTGYFNLNVANPATQGICYLTPFGPDNPFIAAQLIGNNGGFIMSGTSCFVRDYADNYAFMRNCTSALLNCSFFPVSEANPEHSIIESLRLSSSPNPFNAQCTISFYLPEDSFAQLLIYNVRGQIVFKSNEIEYKKGQHSFNWSAYDKNKRALSSGIYFYKLKTDKSTLIRKMLLLK